MVASINPIFFTALLCFLQLFGLLYGADDSCKENGFMCRNKCKELVRCTPSSNYSFVAQVVRTCDGTIHRFCNASSLDCDGSSCQDRGLEDVVLSCYENGTYPHPTDCRKYFSCINQIIYEKLCPTNTSYNAATQNCSSSLVSRGCVEGPIPRCESLEDIGVYADDLSVFYVCSYDVNGYLRPQFHSCKPTYQYDPEQKSCVYVDPNSGPYLTATGSLLSLAIILISRL